MSTVENPYARNLLSYTSHAFFGRQADIQLFEAGALRRPPRSFALVGPRGIGKSWFLHFLCDNSREAPAHAAELISIYCDLRAKPEWSPVAQVCEAIIRNGDKLLAGLPACRNAFQKLQSIWEQVQAEPTEEPSADPTYTLCTERLRDPLRHLCRAMNSADQPSVQICLDHFDEVLEKTHDGEEAFLRELVTLVSFVVTIRSKILDSLLGDYQNTSPFLNMMLLRHIGALNDEEAEQLINQPLEREGLPGGTFSPEEVRFLIDCAGRHPLPLTLACDYYMRQRSYRLDVCDPIIRERLTQGMLAIPEMAKYYAAIWYELSTRQQQLLQHIAIGATMAELEAYRASLQDIISRALLLEDVDANAYRLFSHIFKQYVLGHAEAVAEEHLPYDVLTIIEPELSPLDRKLWIYLRQHPDRICTREELLEHVWEKEQPSPRGLEAAIYRIRSKLSDFGAGNWEFIQTSRRLGYKFVPRAE